jgi:hypothetical protein
MCDEYGRLRFPAHGAKRQRAPRRKEFCPEMVNDTNLVFGFLCVLCFSALSAGNYNVRRTFESENKYGQ